MQRTFGTIVGLEPLVPVRRHPDDDVECSDGTICKHTDAYYDCADQAHRDEEDRDEADVQIVREILEAHEQWASEYTDGSHNNDYADGYCYLVSESSHQWGDRIDDWLIDQGNEYDDRTAKAIVEEMANDIDDWEPIYSANEYACYGGPGICLDSFAVGEYEDQIDLSCEERLQRLHEEGRLEGILGELEREFCLYQSSRYCQKTKSRIYDGYVQGDKHPTITVTFDPGGQWYFVVPEQSAKEALARAIATICRRKDG